MMYYIVAILIILLPFNCFCKNILEKYDIFFLKSGTILEINGTLNPFFRNKERVFYEPSDIEVQQMNKNGFIAYTESYDLDTTQYFITKFDGKGEIIESISDNLFGTITFSPRGKFFVQDTYSKGVFLKHIDQPEYIVYIDDNKINDKIIFFHNVEKFIYQKNEGSIYLYDVNSKDKRFISKIDYSIYLGDISHNGKLLLMTDGSRILVLNIETAKMTEIKLYKPTIFSYQERFYKDGRVEWTRPDIVQPYFSWREDGKGFIFTRYPESSNFLWLGFGGKLDPPALYYYDLEEKKEYLITENGTRGKIAIRKKLDYQLTE